MRTIVTDLWRGMTPESLARSFEEAVGATRHKLRKLGIIGRELDHRREPIGRRAARRVSIFGLPDHLGVPREPAGEFYDLRGRPLSEDRASGVPCSRATRNPACRSRLGRTPPHNTRPQRGGDDQTARAREVEGREDDDKAELARPRGASCRNALHADRGAVRGEGGVRTGRRLGVVNFTQS